MTMIVEIDRVLNNELKNARMNKKGIINWKSTSKVFLSLNHIAIV